MKKVFATLLALAGLAAAPVFAAGNEVIAVNVPFDFVINGKALPAGEYIVNGGATAEIVTVRARDGKPSAMVLTKMTKVDINAAPSLAFAVADGKHYLARATVNGLTKNFATPRSNGPAILTYIKAAR